MIVGCLGLLILDRCVLGLSVVDVVWGMSASSSSEEACSNRSSRPGPIRVLRVCMASDVSLPLVSVPEVSEPPDLFVPLQVVGYRF